MKRKLLAIDFDNTIVENAFPGIGKLKDNAKESIIALSKHFKIAIYSSRTSKMVLIANGKELYKKRIKEMKDFLDDNQIPYDYIVKRSDGKIVANYYIDDSAIEFKNNWLQITKRLLTE